MSYQCKYNINVLANYNSGDKYNSSLEVVELVPIAGAGEILRRIIDMKKGSTLLLTNFDSVHPIHDFFL